MTHFSVEISFCSPAVNEIIRGTKLQWEHSWSGVSLCVSSFLYIFEELLENNCGNQCESRWGQYANKSTAHIFLEPKLIVMKKGSLRKPLKRGHTYHVLTSTAADPHYRSAQFGGPVSPPMHVLE
jgi:hypothetical protein